jgi:hypothetical protein
MASNNCSVAPLYLPIQNNTLDDGVASNRGIYCQLGNQQEGFRITFTLNTTRIRNSRDCDLQGNATAVTGCEGASGGVYSTNGTFEAAPPGTFNSTLDPAPMGAQVINGYDTATFFAGLTVPKFPFQVWSKQDATNKSTMAFGADSSVLKALRHVNVIPSRFMGIFMGSRSQNQPLDGHIIIGGYDRSCVKGPFKNFTMKAGNLGILCPLQVGIRNIQVTNLNGTSSTSLMADVGSIVPACIDPLQNQFTLTQAMYARWASFTQHPSNFTTPTTINDPNSNLQLYPIANEPLIGNITITLDNGYTTTIPHYELVSQQRGTDPEGKYAVINSSVLMAAVGTGATDYGQDIPLLGGVYLSQNYLTVDYDSGSFGLAPANTAASTVKDLVTMCSDSSATSTQSSSASSTQISSPSPDTSAPSSTNVGAIAGGVVGGVLLVIIAVIIFVRRCRQTFSLWLPRRKGSASTSAQASDPEHELGKIVTSAGTAPPEPTMQLGQTGSVSLTNAKAQSPNEVHEVPADSSRMELASPGLQPASFHKQAERAKKESEREP